MPLRTTRAKCKKGRNDQNYACPKNGFMVGWLCVTGLPDTLWAHRAVFESPADRQKVLGRLETCRLLQSGAAPLIPPTLEPAPLAIQTAAAHVGHHCGCDADCVVLGGGDGVTHNGRRSVAGDARANQHESTRNVGRVRTRPQQRLVLRRLGLLAVWHTE